jgi:hypothetical protein
MLQAQNLRISWLENAAAPAAFAVLADVLLGKKWQL